MVRPSEAVGDALTSAADFSHDAARHLWGAQALAALGVAMVFVALRGRVTAAEAADLWDLGWWTILATAAPLWTGLYRLELGGKARRGLGVAGVQFDLAEARLLVLGLAFLAATALAFLPVVAVSALIFVLFRFAGDVVLGPLGAVQISFLIAAGVWIGALVGFGLACARCAFAVPATIGKRRLVLTEAWRMGGGWAVTVLSSWILAQAPALMTLALLALVDTLELQNPALGSRWPLPDAAGAGAVLGLVCAFVQAPMTVGVVGYLYRARRERLRASTVRPRRRFRPELLTV